MAASSPSRGWVGRSGIALGTILVALAGPASYDRLVVEDVLFHDGEWLGSSIPRGLSVRCVRHPFGAVEWRVERDLDRGTGAVGGRPWSAPLPRAGTFRAVDGRFTVVQLAREEVPCAPGRAIDDDGESRDFGAWRRLVDDDDELPTVLYPSPPPAYDYAAVLPMGCSPELHPHRENWCGEPRPRFEPGSIASHPRTVCLVEVGVGLHFCVETRAAAHERAVVDWAFIEVLRTAPVAVTARSLQDGHLLWRADVPSDAGEVWLVHTPDGQLGLRANEDYFRLDIATGALERVAPEGADVCNADGSLAVLAEGDLSVPREDPFVLRAIARPGPEWRLVTCETGPDGGFSITAARPGRVLGLDLPSVPITDPMQPLGPGVATYTVDLEGVLVAATYAP